MRRREFITLLGSAAAMPFAARAQQPRRIAVLFGAYTETDKAGQARLAAFLKTLRELGWEDGRNLHIAYRWGAGQTEQNNRFVTELVQSAPDAIVITSDPVLAQLHRLVNDTLCTVIIANFDEASQREILAERMTFEAVIGQDTTKIRVTGEQNAVEIPRLPLEPVCTRVDCTGRWDRFIFSALHLHANARAASIARLETCQCRAACSRARQSRHSVSGRCRYEMGWITRVRRP